MTVKTEVGLLEALTVSADFIHQTFKREIAFVIVEKASNRVLRYFPGKRVDVGYKDGDFANPNDQNIQIALNGRNADVFVDDSVYGVAMNAYSFPIYENGKIVGALGIGKPLDKEQQMSEYVEQIRGIVNELQDKSHVIASHSEELAATSIEIRTQSEKALEDSKKTNDITAMIKAISRQTNLLGLNASIEAARAGQFGVGFNIVAQEVRKLSSQTDESTQKIEEALKSINGNLVVLLENMSHISEASNEEAKLAQDVTVIIDHLNDVSKKLEGFMKELL